MPPSRFALPAGLARATPWALLATLLATLAWSWPLIETPDSAHYRLLAENASPLELLASTRTPGYPWFLRGIAAVCPDLSCLPAAQLVLHGLAAAALGASLFGAGLSRLAATAAAGLVLVDPWVWAMAPKLRNDLLALSLAVATLTALLRVLGAPSPGAWAALSAATTATWLIRPAYLFLPLLAIGVGLLGRRFQARRTDGGPGRSRLAMSLSLATFGPLLLWCLLRLVAVGDFGPVSFTGFNLIGSTASLLDQEEMRSLPLKEARLAREILRRRHRLGLEPIGLETPIASWWAQFHPNVWQVGAPAARRQAQQHLLRTHPPEQAAVLLDVEADRRLTRLSLALIRAQPWQYLRWVGAGWAAALRRLARDPWVLVPALAWVAAWPASALARRRRGGETAPSTPGVATAQAWLVVAAAFYLGGAALALAVEPPEPRYLEAVVLLLPAALAAGAIETWRSLFASRIRPEGARA